MRRNHPNSTGNKDNSEEEEEEQPTKFDRNNDKMDGKEEENHKHMFLPPSLLSFTSSHVISIHPQKV